MGKGMRYDREFKIEIAKQVVSGRRSARSMAREIGAHDNTIYKWMKQYNEDPEQRQHETGGRGNLSNTHAC